MLREALSQPGKQPEEFPEDSELWVWSKALQHLESIQLLMVDLDIQVSIAARYYPLVSDLFDIL